MSKIKQEEVTNAPPVNGAKNAPLATCRVDYNPHAKHGDLSAVEYAALNIVHFFVAKGWARFEMERVNGEPVIYSIRVICPTGDISSVPKPFL